MNVPKVIEKKDEVTDEVNSKEKHELVKSKVVIPEVKKIKEKTNEILDQSCVVSNSKTLENSTTRKKSREDERKLNDSPASTINSSKLKMFEATNRGKMFSISGMWSNVKLGLVKERSTNFWKKSDVENQPKIPNYKTHKKQQKEAKRNSRIIDPNEWMKSENETETKPKNNTNKEKLQKSLSLG